MNIEYVLNNQILINLNYKEKQLIISNIKEILKLIKNKFSINDEKFKYIERVNNNELIISIVISLIPYINTKNNYKLINQIKNLSEITENKKKTIDSRKDDKYKYSNLIYEKHNPEQKIDIYKFIEDNKILLLFTIEEISYKLYNNWLNIFPIIDKKCNLYKNSFTHNISNNKYYINDIEFTWIDYTEKKYINYNGITVNDIYNVFVNYYYLSIINFNYLLQLKNNIPYIIYLNKLLSFDNFNLVDDMLLKKNYLSLDSVTQIKLLEKFKNLSKDDILELIIFFQNNHEINNKSYKEFYFTMSNTDFKSQLQIINSDIFNIIYTYLTITINYFRYTPYINMYFYYDEKINNYKLKNNNIDINMKDNNNNDINLEPFILYQYGQCLYYKYEEADNINKFDTTNSKLWKGLNSYEKNIIVDKIQSEGFIDDKKWLYFIDKGKFNNIFKPNLLDIVFETMFKMGILSEYKFNPYIIDNRYFSDNKTKYIKNYINKKIKDYYKYNDCYYFITNNKYKYLKMNMYPNKNFFDLLTLDNYEAFLQFTFYFYTQITFANKYLNKNVILITGATGQGKSVHVPKLIFLFDKSLDYNIYGKTAITEPRTTPVISNSKFIAEELMVPIEDNKKCFEDMVFTTYAYIQYKTGTKIHDSIYDNYFIRYLTDGKIITELVDNILLKKKHMIDIVKNEYKYFDYNIYDNIIIDESHEHNVYMDLITTILKYTLLFNKSIRVYIASATLDNEEYKYRKYFNVIDNRVKYPINLFYLEKDINVNNIDMRFHISPPGKNTKYNIEEFTSNNSIKNKEESMEEGIKLINEVIRNTGDILFFTVSIKNCIDISKKLNKIIPSDIVAIPLYAAMNPTIRKYLEKLDIYRDDINFNKKIIVDIASNKLNIEPSLKRDYKYNKIIIVATNIAEASITIKSLKTVIDTGYELNMEYDYINEIDEITYDIISDSSRIQRKGRVGRVSDGKVYYTYDITKCPEFKPVKMNKSNINDDINILLCKSNWDIPICNNINYYNKNDISDERDYEIIRLNDENYINSKSIISDMKKFMDAVKEFNYLPEYQFFIKYFTFNMIYNKKTVKVLIPNNLIENIDTIYEEFNDFGYNVYPSGFSINNIYDEKGLFYFNHPNERYIDKNLDIITLEKYKIIGYVDKNILDNVILNDTKSYKKLKIGYIIENLINNNLLVKFATKELCKTPLNKIIPEILKSIPQLEYENNLAIVLIYSILYRCSNDILIIIAFLLGIKFNIINLYKYTSIIRYNKEQKIYDYKFRNLFNNNKGDIYIFKNIYNSFYNQFKYYFKNSSIEEIFVKDEFYKVYSNENYTPRDLTVKIYNNYITNIRSGELNSAKFTKERKTVNTESNYMNIFKTNAFILFCENNKLNQDTFEKILLIYNELKKEFDIINISNNDDLNIIDKINKYMISYYVKDDIDLNINKCFIHSYYENVCNFLGNNKYIKINNKDSNNSEEIDILRGYTINNLYDKRFSPIIPFQYLIFLKKEKDRENIYCNILINVNPIDIIQIGFTLFNYVKLNIHTFSPIDINFMKNYNKNYIINIINKFYPKQIKNITLEDIKNLKNKNIDKYNYKLKNKNLEIINFNFYSLLYLNKKLNMENYEKI